MNCTHHSDQVADTITLQVNLPRTSRFVHMLMSPAQNSKRKLDESCKTKLVKKLNRPTFSMIYIVKRSSIRLEYFTLCGKE